MLSSACQQSLASLSRWIVKMSSQSYQSAWGSSPQVSRGENFKSTYQNEELLPAHEMPTWGPASVRRFSPLAFVSYTIAEHPRATHGVLQDRSWAGTSCGLLPDLVGHMLAVQRPAAHVGSRHPTSNATPRLSPVAKTSSAAARAFNCGQRFGRKKDFVEGSSTVGADPEPGHSHEGAGLQCGLPPNRGLVCQEVLEARSVDPSRGNFLI